MAIDFQSIDVPLYDISKKQHIGCFGKYESEFHFRSFLQWPHMVFTLLVFYEYSLLYAI